jgi:hypothetical protein
MAGVPPVSGEAYTLYFSVTSQADTNIFQANPTIAAGDFQYSNDGGATFGNPGTLPSAVAGNNKVIQAPLTGPEMTPSVGDAILFAGSDAAGGEWQDIFIILTVTTRDVDDLAYPTVSGRSMDVDATGGVEVGTMTAAALADFFNTDSGDTCGAAVAGSVVYEILDCVNTVAFPAGAIQYTYTVTDSTTGLPIEGVEVWFSTDVAGTNIVWKGDTDAFGVARDVNGNLPWLDSGTYRVWKQFGGYLDAQDPDVEIVS